MMAVRQPRVAQSAEQGALPALYAATVAACRAGATSGPDGPGERRGSPALVSMSGRANDRRRRAGCGRSPSA